VGKTRSGERGTCEVRERREESEREQVGLMFYIEE